MRTKRCVAAACLGLVVFSLATGCDRLPGKPKAAERWMAPEQITDFTQLYAQNCAGCHGVDGRLGAARPLHDPLYLALAGSDVLRQVIAHGVPGTAMPAFAEHDGGSLTDAQIDILVTGMYAGWGRPDAVQDAALPPYRLEAGDGQRGAEVYSTFCAHCHGGGGAAGPGAAPSLTRTIWPWSVISTCARRSSPAGRTWGNRTGAPTCRDSP